MRNARLESVLLAFLISYREKELIILILLLSFILQLLGHSR